MKHASTDRAASPFAALKIAALLLSSVLAVHWLRYQLAYGHDADHELAHQGHSYLTMLSPIVGMLLAGSLAAGLLRAANGLRSSSARPPKLATLWLLTTCAVAAIYSAQELTEGIFAPGHPAGFDAVLGNHGWLAVPLAAAFGLLLTLVLRVAKHVEDTIVSQATGTRIRAALRLQQPQAAPNTQAPVRPRQSVLARRCACRAPPLTAL